MRTLLTKMLRKGLDPRVLNALDKSLAKRDQEEERKGPMSVIEKGKKFRRAFDDAVSKHLAANPGCSRARAVEIVSMSPAVSEFHRLEQLSKNYGSSPVPNTREVSWPDKSNEAPLPRGGAMPSSNYASGAPWPHGLTYAEWLESLVADAINKSGGTLSKNQAYDLVLSRPEVRKANEFEKSARLLAASKLYG